MGSIISRMKATAQDLIAKLCAKFGQKQGEEFSRNLEESALQFEADRYEEARRLIEPIAELTPDIAEVRELYGLVLYRQQMWRLAVRELKAFSELAETTEQHPILMDCYRAQGKWQQVEKFWAELKKSQPPQKIYDEGLMVVAGGLADMGKLADAIKLLEGHSRNVAVGAGGGKPAGAGGQKSADTDGQPPDGAPEKKPASTPRQKSKKLVGEELRISYLLADLYDRAGDVPLAVALFKRIEARSPAFLDVRERLSELGA